mmetsp:Transcript_27103/g.66448  ORF Transcript_27103/g.66448 Transcript_27103/m.66448 type:complete len:223 (+) Transcript_27103:410-1078(+)
MTRRTPPTPAMHRTATTSTSTTTTTAPAAAAAGPATTAAGAEAAATAAAAAVRRPHGVVVAVARVQGGAQEQQGRRGPPQQPLERQQPACGRALHRGGGPGRVQLAPEAAGHGEDPVLRRPGLGGCGCPGLRVGVPILGGSGRCGVRGGRHPLPPQPPRGVCDAHLREPRGGGALGERRRRAQGGGGARAHPPPAPAATRVHRGVHAVRATHAHPRHCARQR